jgi:hypothetical protein
MPSSFRPAQIAESVAKILLLLFTLIRTLEAIIFKSQAKQTSALFEMTLI